MLTLFIVANPRFLTIDAGRFLISVLTLNWLTRIIYHNLTSVGFDSAVRAVRL